MPDARTVMIFVGVGAVVGGGFYYFKRVYQPKQALAAAQVEVREWDARWNAARECLLGPKPASAKTAEALAIKELTAEKVEHGACTSRIANISRKDGPETGIDEVEGAWSAVDAATSKFAREYATNVTREGDNGEKLGEALSKLDAAHDRLLSAVELPAPKREGGTLPAATIVPIRDGKTPLKELRIDMLPSAGGVTYYGAAGDNQVEIHLVANAAPQVARVRGGMMRAVPDASWGALAGDKSVQAGAADAEGLIASPVALELKGGAPALAAVVGTAQSGIVVYGNEDKLAIARDVGGGKKPTIEVTPITLAMADRDFDGRVLVLWRDLKSKLHGKIVQPGQPDKVLAVGDDPVEAAESMDAVCLTRDRAWLSTGSGMVGLGDTALPGGVSTHLLGCTPEAAIGKTGPAVYAICTQAGCREEKGTPSRLHATVTAQNGKLIFAAIRGGVLAVWRDGAARYFTVPGDAELASSHGAPAMMLSDGKVLDIVAQTEADYVILRVPAS